MLNEAVHRHGEPAEGGHDFPDPGGTAILRARIVTPLSLTRAESIGGELSTCASRILDRRHRIGDESAVGATRAGDRRHWGQELGPGPGRDDGTPTPGPDENAAEDGGSR